MSSQWYYRPGDYYQLDDISGFKIRASSSRKIPGGQTGGAIVAPKRWEPQHPQDFVRGILDDQTVPQPRPRQPNQFTIVASFATALSPRQTGWITVDNVLGFSPGDRVYVMLDSGEPYYPIVVHVRLLTNQILVSPVLPSTVGSTLGAPIENTVINLGPSGVDIVLTDDVAVPITDESGNTFTTAE